MGWLRDLWSGGMPPELVRDVSEGPTFAVDENSIDPAVFGLTSYSSPTAPAPRMDRRSAVQVPAVKRCRDLIAGTLGGLPIDLIGPQGIRSRSPLFDQPERNVPRSVTMTRLFEDLLFEGIAWWHVTEFAWNGYPKFVERLDPREVEVREGDGVYYKNKPLADAELIRFDSPNDALLSAGARAIRTALKLDAAAANFADEPMPSGYFAPADSGSDPDDDAEVVAMLNAWKTARQTRSTAYVPAALSYQPLSWNPEQLQLSEARQHAVLEIARVAGVDAEDLGVSTTSRTYYNAFDKRKGFVDFTLGGYRQAVEDRLSMGDVSPNGYVAKFNLDSFLRSDPLSRYQAYSAGLQVGAITQDEIRELEDRPPLTTQEANAVAAEQTTVQTFAELSTETTFDSPVSAAFQVDEEKRTIRGLAVPYGVSALSKGKRFQFSKGVFNYDDVSRVKVLVGHDFNRAVGVATELEDTDEGLYLTARIAKGAAGDEVLSMASEGVWDGLSVGLGQGGKFQLRDGVYHAQSAPLIEVSVTPIPSFSDARLTSVAASAENQGDPMEENTETVGAVDFSALTDAIAKGFEGLTFPQREVVSATASTEVKEELPYRFDGTRGEHSFSQDIRDAYMSGDAEARQRLETFIDEAWDAQFAVSTTNVASLNVTQNRPELFVPNLDYSRPLWDLVTTGSIDNVTPFTVPKFSSASGLVAAHTQGVEPSYGAYSATSQTVTPAPMSGKIEINREVWDQGGSPQADQIIWAEMVRGYYEAIEAKIAVTLSGTSTAELNLGSVVDQPLAVALTNYLAGLQFVRGGNRFTAFAADDLLFPALVNAKDGNSRPLFPVLGPTNAQGQVSGGFDSVQVGNMTVRAAWALATANGTNKRSFNFVPSSVYCWASAPKKFTFEYQVKSIDMAIWGYAASAILRDSDVKPIDYAVAD